MSLLRRLPPPGYRKTNQELRVQVVDAEGWPGGLEARGDRALAHRRAGRTCIGPSWFA